MCTAAQRGRRDMVVVSWKFFTGRVSPNENSTQLLLLRLYVHSNWSFELRHLPPSHPLPPVRQTIQYYTAPTLHARQPNEPYTPREICDEPLIPHSTRTAWTYCAVFRSPLHLSTCCWRYGIGDPAWGPRTRHLDLDLYSSRCSFGVEIMLQAGGPQAYTHTHIQGI